MEALWAIIGVVVGAVLPRLLDSRAQRQGDVREINLALIETRDLVWPPHSSTELENYLAKLSVRMTSLGMDRDAVDGVLRTARACIAARHPIEDFDYETGETIEGIAIGTEHLENLDRELERLDERLAAIGRLRLPRRTKAGRPPPNLA